MASRPSILPSWATSGAAEVTQPDYAKRVAGFLSGETIVTGYVNWLFRYLCQWIDYLDSSTTPYTSLTTAFDEMAAGRAATVYEDDSQSSAGSSASAGAQVAALATDGRYLVWAGAGGHPVVQSRDTPGTTIRTLVRSAAGTNRAITMAGDLCAVAFGSKVQLFRVSTGVSIWTYDHGATVHDVAIYDTFVYLCGVASGGFNFTLRVLNMNDGSLLSSYAHGATMFSVWADQGGLYAGGAISGGIHLRSFTYGGGSPVWSVALPQAITASGAIRGDDVHLYAIANPGDVYKIDRLDGGVSGTLAVPIGYRPTGIDVDHGGVFVTVSDSVTPSWLLYKLSKDLGYCWSTVSVQAPTGVASDGGRIWTWGTPTGSNPGLSSSRRQNRPGVYFRRDTAVVFGSTRIRWRYHRKNLSPVGEE